MSKKVYKINCNAYNYEAHIALNIFTAWFKCWEKKFSTKIKNFGSFFNLLAKFLIYVLDKISCRFLEDVAAHFLPMC